MSNISKRALVIWSAAALMTSCVDFSGHRGAPVATHEALTGIEMAADTHVRSDSPNTAWGNSTAVGTGTQTLLVDTNLRDALVRLPTTWAMGIPAGNQIVDARLVLTSSSGFCVGELRPPADPG